MNNIKVTRLYDTEVTKREMNNLEIAGATMYLYTLLNDWYEYVGACNNMTIEDVSSDTYYCNKCLQINNNYGYELIDDEENRIILDYVFMAEGIQDELFGYAYDYREDENYDEVEYFLVRI